MLTGDNGILTQAQRAKNETEKAQLEEENILASYENYLNVATGTNTEFSDSYGNKVIVPAGFEVVNPEDNVEDGIIIEDITYENTKGSQFVWIPVGEIETSNGKITINLNRYTFDESGNEIESGDKVINNYYQELAISVYGNTVSKDLNAFKNSVNDNCGFYIGRYEARDGTAKEERTTQTSCNNKMVCIADNYIYNYVTQTDAASLCQNMYNNRNFTSDLINSFAWETTIVFLQKCDNRNNNNESVYSKQTSLNQNFESKGTVNLNDKDLICNIYDMASNCFEWTTESSSAEGKPCVDRGGSYDDNRFNTSYHNSVEINTKGEYYSFRPILYL